MKKLLFVLFLFSLLPACVATSETSNVAAPAVQNAQESQTLDDPIIVDRLWLIQTADGCANLYDFHFSVLACIPDGEQVEKSLYWDLKGDRYYEIVWNGMSGLVKASETRWENVYR